ncbi:hypothetical protein EIP86_009454 [Pleurotus ostreatoroseus]|nr:hypothetical protein EIP86_009454 [Pleurotus ostreatoroseus]
MRNAHRVENIARFQDLWMLGADEVAGMRRLYQDPPKLRVGKRKRSETQGNLVNADSLIAQPLVIPQAAATAEEHSDSVNEDAHINGEIFKDTEDTAPSSDTDGSESEPEASSLYDTPSMAGPDASIDEETPRFCICDEPEYGDMVQCDGPGCGQWVC